MVRGKEGGIECLEAQIRDSCQYQETKRTRKLDSTCKS